MTEKKDQQNQEQPDQKNKRLGNAGMHADDQDRVANDDQHNERGQQGKGRISNTGKGEDESHDISSVDRQEGEMNHGETGGNFPANG